MTIGFQVGRELVERTAQLIPFGPYLNSRVMLDEFDQRVETLKAFMYIAVPQGPFGAIQQEPKVFVRIFGISIPNLDALGDLLQHREPHSDPAI